MFDYKLLEAMAMVVKEKGFDRAAKALHITQSAVSQRIKLLEESTGQILLARTSPPTPTPAGQKVLKHFLQVAHLETDLFNNLRPSSLEKFESIAIGINADSLSTWFFPAIGSFLETERATLDLRVDDQEQTHRFLRNGDVVGCISSQDIPVQGCDNTYLGTMKYRLLATPCFSSLFFPDGMTKKAVLNAPAIIYNREDDLLNKIFLQLFDQIPASIPTNHLPSSEKFVEFIASGLAYGMIPDLQGHPLIQSGKLINLAPDFLVSVDLYWHCWNLKSAFLNRFSKRLISEARKLLSARE